MIKYFNDTLHECLLIAQEDFKEIKEVYSNGNISLKTDITELTRLNDTHNGVEEFYRKRNDGWEIEWFSEKEKGICGSMKFAETKYLFSDNNGLYDEGDSEDLKYFRPLDYPTDESFVGFIIKPDTIYKSLYYMSVSDYELMNLDLDYEGYTQMAVEARVFNHWQLVLLYYMDGEDIGSVETEIFQTEMPKLFPGWTWENFITKFESLRLSKKEK